MWIVLTGLMMAAALVFILLPPPPPLLALLMLGTITLVVRRSGHAQSVWRKIRAGRSLVLKHRAWATRLLTLIACVLMIASAVFLRPDNWPGVPTGFGLALAGLIAVGIALGLAQHDGVQAEAAFVPLIIKRSGRRWVVFGLGVLVLAVLADVNGMGIISQNWLPNVSYHAQFALFCAGIVLTVWGLSDVSGFSLRQLIARTETRLVATVTLLAFFLRFVALEHAVHFFVDELIFGMASRHFLADPYVKLLTPFGEDILPFPYLFPYLQSVSSALFGPNLVGLRLVSVLFGTLTIPALYLLIRTLFDRKTALVAALLLATFPPHIHFSRLGLNNIADPLFGTLTLAFLARGLHTERRTDFAIAGACLGLTQYFYEGGKLLYPVLVVAWLGWIVLFRRAVWATWHIAHTNLITFLFAALLVAAPLYYTLFVLHEPATARLNIMSWLGELSENALHPNNGAPRFIFESQYLTKPFLFYVHQTDELFYYYYYGGQQALIVQPLVPLFLLGVSFAFWRWRQPEMLLLLLWVILTSFGNGLLRQGAVSPRYVVVFPALAALLALGIRQTLGLLLPRKTPSSLVVAGLSVVVLVSAAGQTLYYFGPHLAFYNTQLRSMRPHPDSDDVAFRSADFPAATQIHVVSPHAANKFHMRDMLTFLQTPYALETLTDEQFTPSYLADLAPDVDHAFFLAGGDDLAAHRLHQALEVEGPFYSTYNLPLDEQFVLYYWRHDR